MKADEDRGVTTPRVDPGPGLLRAIAGFIVWSVAFVVLYVAHGIACLYVGPGDPGAVVTKAVLLVLWILHLALLAWMSWRSRGRMKRVFATRPSEQQPPSRFMSRLTLLLDLFALAAVLASGLPIILMKVCSGPLLL